uniref:growth arrest and DNA damage-inducible protein GADD45 alpha-like n=1 Tax=Myxine glutinosa TaxID=7769 RepID=UPI00358E1665
MTLEEAPEVQRRQEEKEPGSMESVGKALEKVLMTVDGEGRLTAGVYEAAKLLNVSVDGVALCLLAAEPVELAQDLALQIHFTLLQAFCAENEIAVALLTEPARLNTLLPVGTDGAPRDCHCVLIGSLDEGDPPDPALDTVTDFCLRSIYTEQWVPTIVLPER